MKNSTFITYALLLVLIGGIAYSVISAIGLKLGILLQQINEVMK